MARFLLTEPARHDLQGIKNYLATERGIDPARRVLRGLEGAMKQLAVMPRMGHVREDLTDEPLRFWSVNSYLIVYDPESSPLEVFRVLHGARDVRRELGEG